MNAKLNGLFARRSIRVFTPDDVSEQLVRDCLDAAMAAPSACCRDPWHFIVLRDREMLTAVASGLPNGTMLATAPVGVVVCGDSDKAHDGQLSFLLQDCSAAIENFLLAASFLGLGACWLGVHPRPERMAHLRSLLEIPERIVPVSAIALGWPGQQQDPRTRYADSAVHTGQW